MTRIAHLKVRDADGVAHDVEAGKPVTAGDILMLVKMYRAATATVKAQKQVIQDLGDKLKQPKKEK